MDERIIGIHTLSRRYFIEIIRSSRNALVELFKKLNKECINQKNEEVMNLLKDFNKKNPYCLIKKDISQAILNKIEAISPEKFYSLQEIKKRIISVCEKAEIDDRTHYCDVSKELKREICNNEKQKFISHIDSIDEDYLVNIEPLFYRRVLSKEKINEIKEDINKTWYKSKLNEKDTMCFEKSYFNEKIKTDYLLAILKRKKVEKIYMVNTGGINSASYIMDISALDLYYTDGFDIYWCSDKVDWMIVESHEGFYSIYGDWLKAEIGKLI
ncbi:hypothetical protein [Proteiniborus sp. MB09-C3]|uniref:hypothetical protein n=1 Tax=Proteiniborus sp. MB09-C3 TaxID=3050072 RepID=UPI002552DD2F|nr:hypothetical protein [Proteiniborus sp. MB09-C3]WIV11054.1 hypothetical protein QO263_12935 [Proteiniborus sp. MB09-C3]